MMQSATHMHDPSLYNKLLTDAELRVVISCDNGSSPKRSNY